MNPPALSATAQPAARALAVSNRALGVDHVGASFVKVLLTAISLAVAACTSPPQPTVLPASLPILASPFVTCIGTGLAAILKGDPADPSVAWIEDFPGGGDRQEIVWPPGYSARFTPSLEILDDKGVVVVRGGDYVDGDCGLQSGGRLLLAPPFMALRLDCGPLDLTTCQFYLVTATTASGWPDREIAELRFTSAGGDYDVIYEDGTTATGRTR